MMGNATHISFFILTGYFDSERLKYLFFVILVTFYVLILVSNVFVMVVISVNRRFHEPMHLFLCSLFVNELFGSTGLFPFLLFQVLRDIHIVSASLCFLQIFCLYSYVSGEFTTLAVISYDRYLAICFPLQYHAHMKSHKIFLLISLSWIYPFMTIITLILLTAPLRLCGNIIHKVYCDNYSIVKLSCSDTTVNNIYGFIITVIIVFVPLCFIFYTYMRILKVCFSGSKQTRHKAVSTCTPHLASLFNFSFGVCLDVLQSRFHVNNASSVFRVLSLYFLTCQPLFNPVMYRLKLSTIRIMCKNLLFDSLLKCHV